MIYASIFSRFFGGAGAPEERRPQSREEDLIRAYLPLVLLALLARRRNYGYGLIRRLEALGFPTLRREGDIYPALGRMEVAGLLDAWLENPSEGGPARKYYAITPSGREELDRLLAVHRTISCSLQDGLAGSNRAGGGS